MTRRATERAAAATLPPLRTVWTLYKAPDLDALAIGLETCELGNWKVFQILRDAHIWVIVASKELAHVERPAS